MFRGKMFSLKRFSFGLVVPDPWYPLTKKGEGRVRDVTCEVFAVLKVFCPKTVSLVDCYTFFHCHTLHKPPPSQAKRCLTMEDSAFDQKLNAIESKVNSFVAEKRA